MKMAGKENSNPQKFEFPFEWLQGEWGQTPGFAVNQTLIQEMNNLKDINDRANADLSTRRDIASQSHQHLVLTDAQHSSSLADLGVRYHELPAVRRAATQFQMHSTTSVNMCRALHADLKVQLTNNRTTLSKVTHELADATSVLQNLSNIQAQLHAGVENAPQRSEAMTQQLRELDTLCERLRIETRSLLTTCHDLTQVSKQCCVEFEVTRAHVLQLGDSNTLRDELRERHEELLSQVSDYCDITPDLRLAARDLEQLKVTLSELKAEIGFIVSTMAY